ncbi:MAG TPA: HEAT repeat domain-containing protein [Polyangiaceae bacterium]|nr:HEAT repeat domain-containing protein [Polyangiaceae bacterium]
MGLFDLFRKKDGASADERELQRLQKASQGKLSQDLDRQDALERLASMGTAPAVRILLQRFDWALDPSIRDQEEKELALGGIVKAGDAAIPEIRTYCVKAQSLTWPFKALRRLVDAEGFERELLVLLERFDTDYQRNPEPKIQLLQALEEFSSDATRSGVEPFLDDSSEAVRFAAVNALFGIGSAQSVGPLVQVLANDESLRIRNRIAQGLVERSWDVPDGLQAGSLPPGFTLRGSVLVGAPRA